MAKKKDPDQIDKVIAELTSNTTAAELINDPSVLRELKKRLVEAALEAEMTDHLGYDKHSPDGHNSGNSRNGKSSKRILDGDGDYVIDVPRDRAGDFEPQFVRKRQVRLPGFDEKVLSLYATGLTTRQIGASLHDILIASVDGLTGFPDAIQSVFAKTEIQLCIVHLVRNSLRYVPWKNRRAVARDLKKVYTAATAEAAARELDAFEAAWGDQYPMAARSWRSRWENVIPFFSYPEPIRKVIYTTNAVESLNAQLRQVTKRRGAFPTEDSVRKVLYLAISRAAKRWTMPVQDWPAALNYFSIVFAGRVPV
jgi:transposase-like protein